MRKKIMWIIVTGVLLIYIGISLSSVPKFFGRFSPSIAAFFSPPYFNFKACYQEGQVFGFQVGMTRKETIAVLSEKGLPKFIWANPDEGKSKGVRAGSDQIFNSPDQFMKWGEKQDYWDGAELGQSLVLQFYFEADFLSKICVTKVNFEGF